MARKIAILADVVGGGTGNHLFRMLSHLKRPDLRIRLLSQAPATATVPPPVPLEVLPSLGAVARYPFAQIQRARWLIRHFKRHPIDILHTYFFWSILYGRLLKRLGIVPVLVENREDEGFAWGRHEYGLLRITRGLPDRVVCVSEAVRRVVIEREGLPAERVMTIHNGWEPRRTEAKPLPLRRELGLADQHLVVGMVANMNRPVKGLSYFIESIPTIVNRSPDARFVLIGLGQEHESLQRWTRELDVAGHLILAGFRKNIRDFYALMDISVLTSLSEGLSLTLLESSGCGLPVVATDVGGNAEVIEDGVTGFLVPPRDPVTFADRVCELLEDPELRRRFGAAGRKKIRREFMLSTIAGRYADLYGTLISLQERSASSLPSL